MKRAGFTMVELIFVIVIIGILAAVALPRFGGVKDRARANTELASLNSLESSITAESEFRIEDFGDTNVNWHEMDTADFNQTTAAQKIALYNTINTDNQVLRRIMKKGDNIEIAGFWGVNANGSDIQNNDTGLSSRDILILRGQATNPLAGVPFRTDVADSDIDSSPDRNDLWIFNPNNFDINVTSSDIVNTPLRNTPSIVEARSILLIDITGTSIDANQLISDLRTVATGSTQAPRQPQIVQ